MRKGFTLIELLVVVLIIGILAAIALPQYTKAVERSRIAEAAQHLGDIATAQSIYYMQKGTYAGDISTLNQGDVVIPSAIMGSSDMDWSIAMTGGSTLSLTATRSKGAYAGGKMILTLDNQGNMTKSHSGPTDTSVSGNFGGMVETAGY